MQQKTSKKHIALISELGHGSEHALAIPSHGVLDGAEAIGHGLQTVCGLRGMTISGLSRLGSCQTSLESDHGLLVNLSAQHASLLQYTNGLVDHLLVYALDIFGKANSLQPFSRVLF